MKVLDKDKIESFLNRLAEDADVFVPMQRGPQTGFYSWGTYDEDHDDLMLDILNVYIPPKNIMIPPHARMGENSNEPGDRIIFGIRSCDVRAIDLLDEVFLTQENEGRYYKEQRNKTILVASACYYPAPSCFCDSMGANPVEPASADVVIHDVGREGYVWESRSPKGAALTDTIADWLGEKEIIMPQIPHLSRGVDFEGVFARLLDYSDLPLWENYSEPCQTCAVCIYTCPTCNCFDLQAQTWRDQGYNFNCYETCMYRPQSLMKGLSNPRIAARERFRNRFLHKLQFFSERYGQPLCTGCGRCTVLCPAGIDIVKVITEIKEHQQPK
ncbi:Alpha-helical ferredoxin [Syntrophomonas zehnderi OL-4]|uniref:Alpha-helical ferredoxin n=1 Tax=Syntrophomonas zehnderi OL-4 TaxID=690567 RepID=A0A0E4C7Z9_9FIRM|nr:Alpha-helical ferredoxin [Syntrophomonas zehnderi OL-4]